MLTFPNDDMVKTEGAGKTEEAACSGERGRSEEPFLNKRTPKNGVHPVPFSSFSVGPNNPEIHENPRLKSEIPPFPGLHSVFVMYRATS
jgi:hypothetical protein